LRACPFFEKFLCPSCYAKPLWNTRRAMARHVHKRTKRRGLIRLGTYTEVTPRLWAAFKAGRGRWDCCGKSWSRRDFRVRPYFFITRGLSPPEFYQRVLADARLVNLQVSVDVLPGGQVVPGRDRLRWFMQSEKVIFRFKTTTENVLGFLKLQEVLQIPRHRIMETPLRTLKRSHQYNDRTPLERVGWYWRVFGRCNTLCSECYKENGVLLCSATPSMLRRLPQIERPPPPRSPAEHIQWKAEAASFLAACGGSFGVQEAYDWFLGRHPGLRIGHPNWKWKVRVGLKRAEKMVLPELVALRSK